MKNHIAFKFLAVLLCALTLMVAIFSIVGIVALEQQDLYDEDLEQQLQERREEILQQVASDIAVRYAAEYLGGCDQITIQGYYGDDYWLTQYFHTDRISWDILDENGQPLYLGAYKEDDWQVIQLPVTWHTYICAVPEEDATEQSLPAGEVAPPGVSPTGEYEGYDLYSFPDYEAGVYRNYQVTFYEMPAWKVILYLDENPWLLEVDTELVMKLWENRYNLFYVLGGSLLLFAIGAVYLCCAAGKKPGTTEIKPGGFNAMPLDLYAGLILFVLAIGLMLLREMSYWSNDRPVLFIAFIVFGAFFCCLVFVAYCFACAAQFKMPDWFFLRRSLCGMTLITLFRGSRTTLRFLNEKLPPLGKKLWTGTGSLCKKLYCFTIRVYKKLYAIVSALCLELWKVICQACRFLSKHIGNLMSRVWHFIRRFFELLPLTWQWLLVGIVMIFMLFITIISFNTGWILLAAVLCLGIILYGAHAFGILMEATKRMGQGDLDTKVSDQFLLGSFKDFAGHLNDLADVAVVAAQKQMKSERMKTELITNVSHDIKTPLTSIINYVDLLQLPHSQEDEAQYLEVLGRKSQQLKKLIDDLMEMSKASTGNLTVDIRQVDAAEALTQALGEFSDKLAATPLSPVFQAPEDPVMIKADGRLVWRVLSNILSNAVKYALPGTRLYIDLAKQGGKVLISVKNISREPLNVSAEELMERFVRGDAARNTEGSGLGLNIAKSLMEVQHGQLQLLVDGDLFKVTLVFPGVEEPQ